MSLAEAIQKKEFDKAVELINTGNKQEIESELKGISFFQNLHYYASFFQLMEALVDKGLLEFDVYEYSAIETSVFGNIIHGLSREEAISDDRLHQLKTLLSKANNLDEPLRGVNFMTYALNNNVPIKVIETIVQAGCKVHFLDDYGETYLHKIATKPEIRNYGLNQSITNQTAAYLDFFMEQGLDINAQDKNGITPLLKMVSFRNRIACEHMRMFLERGADVEARTPDDQTALDIALKHQETKQCHLLLEYGAKLDTDKQDKKKQSVVYRFLNGALYEFTKTNEDLFKILLDAGFDPYQENKNSYGKEETPIDLILKKSPEYLQFMLDALDLNVNIPDQNGNTLLHNLCNLNVNFEEKLAKDLYRKAKILLKAGANPNLQNNDGKTAIDLASQDEKKLMTVQLLLKQKG